MQCIHVESFVFVSTRKGYGSYNNNILTLYAFTCGTLLYRYLEEEKNDSNIYKYILPGYYSTYVCIVFLSFHFIFCASSITYQQLSCFFLLLHTHAYPNFGNRYAPKGPSRTADETTTAKKTPNISIITWIVVDECAGSIFNFSKSNGKTAPKQILIKTIKDSAIVTVIASGNAATMYNNLKKKVKTLLLDWFQLCDTVLKCIVFGYNP